MNYLNNLLYMILAIKITYEILYTCCMYIIIDVYSLLHEPKNGVS